MNRTPKTCLALGLAALTALLAPPASADSPALDRAKNAILRGDFVTAEKEIASVKGGPERADALLMKAGLELETGRYADAVATARSAAGLGKGTKIDAKPLEAEALARQGKTDEAIAALKEVAGEDKAFRANVELGELLLRTGKRDEGRAALRRLVQAYNDDKITDLDPVGLTLVGRAEHLLRNAKQANHAYNLAEKAGAKKSPETLLFRADLFLERYDPGHAGEVVKEALKLSPRDPEARVAMARVKLENAMDFEGAESELKQALEVNPNLAGAYAVRSGLALRDMDIAAADAAITAGLKTNPNDLELLSMQAAVRFLADDPAGFAAVKQKVFALNPGYSRFFSIVSEFAEWEHRYDDIVKMMREAIAADPGDGKAYATLGLNLIRGGDDVNGVAALKSAWEKDKFNIRVFNTLDLYEKTIPTDYVTVEGQPFRIRYAKDEKAVLERYVPRMLDEAWGSMVKRYGFTPKNPVYIELYATSESFSIRTSGLPNVGIQGVCFGQTLAALSPEAAPFNWGQVLWHELGHVFAIQLSKNHVPRWFTEGLSEYETIVRRPEWQREEDPALFAAFKAGRIPPVDGFNRAFTHVDDVEDVTMAYFAASQILVYVAEQFGFPPVVQMLQKWGKGERTAEVVKESLGITADELDKRFRAWVGKRLDRYNKQYVPDLHAPPLDDARKAALAAPGDAKKQVRLALALFGDGQMQEGEAVLSEALRLDPKQPDATYVRLRMAFRGKKFPEAATLIKKMIADGNDGYAVRMKAADLAEAEKDLPRMKENLEAAAKLDPIQAEPLQGLYDLAHKQKDAAGELAALRRLAALDQHSRKVWGMLLDRLLERGEWEEARKVGESAMFIDVENPNVHRAYARALARTGHFVTAVYELNSAILCKPKPKDVVAIYGELATAYDKLKEPLLKKQAEEFKKQMEAAPAPSDAPKQKGPHGPDDDEDGPMTEAPLRGTERLGALP